jgi:hypothetical protein
MKNLIYIFISLFLMACSAFAQEEMSLQDKRGNLILPEKGNYAIRIGTNSAFNYLGNMFNSSGSNNLALSLLYGNQLYGKYFLSDKTAVRSRVSIFYSNNQTLQPNYGDYQQDYHSVKDTYYLVDVTAGYEKRRGRGRLQFSYGPEFTVGTGRQRYTTYINENMQSNYIDNKGLIVGARVFTGIEYFFLSKISVGAEVGYGIRANFFGKTTQQIWNGREVSSDNLSINANADMLGGQIYLLFHL